MSDTLGTADPLKFSPLSKRRSHDGWAEWASPGQGLPLTAPIIGVRIHEDHLAVLFDPLGLTREDDAAEGVARFVTLGGA